jgi:Hydrolytic ATP binding site of dynein motor region
MHGVNLNTTYFSKVVQERGLQLDLPWMNKCIQLYETCLVRHGIMLVGPSGAGGTSCRAISKVECD